MDGFGADELCIRFCPTDYDQMGCWFYTGNAVGADGVYQDCSADDGDPPGVVGGSTYTQVSYVGASCS